MTNESNPKPFPQAATHAIVVVASVALTLGTLRIFPQLLPSAKKANNSDDISSQALTLPSNQPRNFVATAVNRVGDAVVRSVSIRTTASPTRLTAVATKLRGWLEGKVRA